MKVRKNDHQRIIIKDSLNWEPGCDWFCVCFLSYWVPTLLMQMKGPRFTVQVWQEFDIILSNLNSVSTTLTNWVFCVKCSFMFYCCITKCSQLEFHKIRLHQVFEKAFDMRCFFQSCPVRLLVVSANASTTALINYNCPPCWLSVYAVCPWLWCWDDPLTLWINRHIESLCPSEGCLSLVAAVCYVAHGADLSLHIHFQHPISSTNGESSPSPLTVAIETASLTWNAALQHYWGFHSSFGRAESIN